MGTPFATTSTAPASLVIPATDGQLRFITTLLAERVWQNGPEKHVRRAAALKTTLSFIADPTDKVIELMAGATSWGEQLNLLLAHMAPSAIAGQEFVWAPLSKAGASKLIDWLMDRDQGERKAQPAASGDVPSAEVVPAGRYAIETEDGATNGLAFYKVDRPTEGRWAGRVFVKLMVSDEEQRMSWAASKSILAKIAEVGAAEASARYGHEIGECGVCGRTLTNDESRERGIGPICAAKNSW
ncbi:hypothetical protein I5G62_gp48 [Mycobacterium phage CRB2]|uniref:Uncharacterized protein n=1 Tax=Mycobacterium phage CRB2 TaxID=2483623 RepID=A0A455LM18_9CAUD|nr:hypothetical protein I5G62_gp48 [Mycobacterium phage CRB2]AYP70034.1 hypothetical protein CRB2_48 [Mycobacterium phage CRB2]